MQLITSRRERAGLRRTLWIVLALGLVSPVIASCTNGGSASHRSNNSARTSTATRVHNLLACLTAACQAGPGGEPKKVSPPPRSGGGPASPGSPVAYFDWSMPPRFDASWDAWNTYDQPAVTIPGHTARPQKDYNPSFVNPRRWNPSFNACLSRAGNNRPGTGQGGRDGTGAGLVSFQWGLWRDGREIDTAKTSSCKLGNHPADPPVLRLDVPALGSYFVTLSVTNWDGKSASTVREVTVRDLLVVTFGDSSASGEGNRDQDTGWEERRCHRSRTSGPALAAQYLEQADPKTSVTYLNLACSGASVTSGIIGPYASQQNDFQDFVPLEPQTDALVRAICGGRPAWRCQPSQQRPVDILTINIGVNDLGFSSLLTDCDTSACLEHHWDTALHERINGLLTHNRTAPSCKTAQQRFEEIPGVDQAAALKRGAAIGQANKYCDTANWGHGFQYIADRLKDEGVKVAQTYLSTYPVNFLSGARGQPETTEGCGFLSNIGQDEAKFMTQWGYVLNNVIQQEAVRLGWYPVTGLPTAFRGHGYCALTPAPGDPELRNREPFFVTYNQSLREQGNQDGTAHPNRRGHAAWATRYLAAIAAPKPTPAPEFTVRVHLDTFRIFLPGVGPEGSNGACNGNLATGVPVNLFVDATLAEAGFGKPVAHATYQVRMKPVRFQFQPSEWYQFHGAALTFPLSSVDDGLHVTIASPLCHASPSEPQSEFIQIHRPRPYPPDGSDLAGPFQLRSSPDTRAIEVSGCIDVTPTAPQVPPLHPGLVIPCHAGQRAPLTP
jgi:lysophospholipase L1-like esterase